MHIHFSFLPGYDNMEHVAESALFFALVFIFVVILIHSPSKVCILTNNFIYASSDKNI